MHMLLLMLISLSFASRVQLIPETGEKLQCFGEEHDVFRIQSAVDIAEVVVVGLDAQQKRSALREVPEGVDPESVRPRTWREFTVTHTIKAGGREITPGETIGIVGLPMMPSGGVAVLFLRETPHGTYKMVSPIGAFAQMQDGSWITDFGHFVHLHQNGLGHLAGKRKLRVDSLPDSPLYLEGDAGHDVIGILSTLSAATELPETQGAIQ